MKVVAKPKPKRPTSRSLTRVAAAGSIQRETPVPVPVRKRQLRFGDRWDYAPAPETVPVQIEPRYHLFIDGKFVPPRSGKFFDSSNPATEEKLSEIALADEQDVNAAVKAARRAYENVWSKMPGRERGKYLFRIARIIQEKSRELAVLETMDGGKPIKESRDIDLPLVAAHFLVSAQLPHRCHDVAPGGAGGNFRPGPQRDDLPHAGRSD